MLVSQPSRGLRNEWNTLCAYETRRDGRKATRFRDAPFLRDIVAVMREMKISKGEVSEGSSSGITGICGNEKDEFTKNKK